MIMSYMVCDIDIGHANGLGAAPGSTPPNMMLSMVHNRLFRGVHPINPGWVRQRFLSVASSL